MACTLSDQAKENGLKSQVNVCHVFDFCVVATPVEYFTKAVFVDYG
jgi:hypothetical protein